MAIFLQFSTEEHFAFILFFFYRFEPYGSISQNYSCIYTHARSACGEGEEDGYGLACKICFVDTFM